MTATAAVPTPPPSTRSRSRDVEPLTDDAAAVTFDVPDDLRRAFAFEPGQSLTLRRVVDGVEHRRSYSICAPAGGAPRIGVREIPGGLFSSWLVREVGPGDQVEVQTPQRQLPRRPGEPGPPPVHRRRLRHHADAVDRGDRARQPGQQRHAALRQPRPRLGDVRRGARPTSRTATAPASSSSTCCPASRATSSCSRAGSTPTGCGGCSPLLVPLAAVDHVWLCGPFAMIARRPRRCSPSSACRREKVHFELFYVDEPPPELHRADAVVEGETSDVTVVLDGRTHDHADAARRRPILDAAQAVRSRPAVRLQGRRLRHLPGHWSSTARSTCAATTPSSAEEVERGSC